jgi:hypothetical protein
VSFEHRWTEMKRHVQSEANRLIADFPDFPGIRVATLDMAERFCAMPPPTDSKGLVEATNAQAVVLDGFDYTRKHLSLGRRSGA